MSNNTTTSIIHKNEITLDNNYFEVEEDKIMSNCIICTKCNKETCLGNIINVNNDDLCHYYCSSCNFLFAVCYKCENIQSDTVQLAQLIKQHNFYNITDNSNDYVIDIDTDIEGDTFTWIRYTQPTYYFDIDRFETFTGDDGGWPSVWKCKCSTYVVYDK